MVMSFRTDDSRYVKVPAVERNLANGRMLVQRLDADKAVQLSGSAPLIWSLLDTFETVPDIVGELVERFSDSAETIEAGVRQALDSFVEQKVVDRS